MLGHFSGNREAPALTRQAPIGVCVCVCVRRRARGTGWGNDTRMESPTFIPWIFHRQNFSIGQRSPIVRSSFPSFRLFRFFFSAR